MLQQPKAKKTGQTGGYFSLYDLVQEAGRLEGGEGNDWGRQSKLKPTESEMLLLKNAKFSLKEDENLAKDYMAAAAQ